MIRTVALALLALVCAAPATAITPDGARLDTALPAGFSGVAIVGRGGEIVWSHATGAHRLDETWRLASVTKQLTALIVMQEAAAGRLDLDAPMTTLWPGWPAPNAAGITPRRLLRHDSGLADPAGSRAGKDGVPEFYRRTGAAADPARSAAGYCALAPRAQPGSGFHYNNCDYIVLGALLERLTGMPFATLLDERIARPLGLTSLGLFAHDAPAPANVRGTVLGKPEPAVNLGSYGAAGSAYIAPADLWKVDRALLEHRLLDKIATAEMWRGDPALGYSALGAWGFAARLAGCPDPVDLIERRGMIEGVQVRNFLAPASRTAVIAFVDNGDLDFGEVWQGRGPAYELLSAALCPAP